MNSALLVKQCGIDNYQWLAIGDDSNNKQVNDVDIHTGDSESLAKACKPGVELILLASTEDTTLREVGFEAHEKKMLRQTIPFSLEDDLLDDVDDVHFALGDVLESFVVVAWVKKNQLDQWLDLLKDHALDCKLFLPELLLLPCEENSWTLLIDDDRWILKNAKYHGFSLEAANAGLALQLMLDESDHLPSSLVVYAGDNDESAILNQLPEMLRGIVEWRDQDYWDLVASTYSKGLNSSIKKLDLLQGEYERQLPWLQWWTTWRVAAIIFAVATILQFSVGFGHKSVLESTNVALREETEKVYRSVISRGPVINPVKQLKRKMREVEGGSGGSFVAMLDKVGQVVSSSKGLKIHSLNYTEKKSEIRLTVMAPEFDDVETARVNMEKLGITAKLTGSSRENGQIRARLLIKS